MLNCIFISNYVYTICWRILLSCIWQYNISFPCTSAASIWKIKWILTPFSNTGYFKGCIFYPPSASSLPWTFSAKFGHTSQLLRTVNSVWFISNKGRKPRSNVSSIWVILQGIKYMYKHFFSYTVSNLSKILKWLKFYIKATRDVNIPMFWFPGELSYDLLKICIQCSSIKSTVHCSNRFLKE